MNQTIPTAFEYHHTAESTDNANQPPTQNFDSSCFRTMPVNQAENYYVLEDRKMLIFFLEREIHQNHFFFV